MATKKKTAAVKSVQEDPQLGYLREALGDMYEVMGVDDGIDPKKSTQEEIEAELKELASELDPKDMIAPATREILKELGVEVPAAKPAKPAKKAAVKAADEDEDGDDEGADDEDEDGDDEGADEGDDEASAKPAKKAAAKVPGKVAGVVKPKKAPVQKKNRVEVATEVYLGNRDANDEELIELANSAYETEGGSSNLKESRWAVNMVRKVMDVAIAKKALK